MKMAKKLCSVFVSAVLCCAFIASCTQEPPQEQQFAPGQIAGFNLPHFSGLAETDNQYYYNSELFYKNETQNEGADPTCVFASVEDITDTYNKHKQSYMYKTESGEWDWIDGESEEKFTLENGTLQDWLDKYSNRYYMATTGATSSISGEVRNTYGSDIVTGAYSMKSSDDLVNWKRCGLIDGYAIAVRKDSFAAGSYWAPEILRDSETGYYFMFFSCQTKSGNQDTIYPAYTSNEADSHTGMMAISTNPVGPYELITAEDYITIKAAKNKDGSVKTGTELIVNKFNNYKYYEVYDNDGNVIGYKNAAGFYNLNGYEVTQQTPIIIPGYYYPRFVEDSEEKTAKLAELEPYVNVQVKSDGEKSYNLGLIDLFPAIDDKGNLFTFFTVEASYAGNPLYGIWVVEMIDIITPKWDTLRMVLKPGVNKVVDDGTFLGDWQGEVDGVDENNINEGTEIIYHKGKWYLTYSFDYYNRVQYSVGIAVSDNALGPYDKLEGAFSPLVGRGDEYNNYKAGTGHHVFVTAGEELFILYHATHNPENNYDNQGNYLGRHINVDRGVWKYVPELGYDMLFCNGATVNLQPKPETITGYTNVAKLATITGNGDVGEVEYVNDGLITAQPFARRFEYGKTDGGLEITLKWDSPVRVKALMIYNAGSYYQAFNKVSTIRIKLAEKPAWYSFSEYNGYCYIKDLPVDPADELKQYMVLRHGSAAIAEFDEIKITEMYVYLSGDADDKFTEEDESGAYWDGYKEVHVSDIYVFGQVA